MPEPHARADLEQAVGLGRGRRLRRDAERRAASRTTDGIADRLGGRDNASSRRVSAGNASNRRRNVSSMPRRNRHRADDSAKPPASCPAARPRGSSSNASGFPSASATILSSHVLVQDERDHRVQQGSGIVIAQAAPGTSSGSPRRTRAWCAHRTATRPDPRAVAERRTPSSAPKRGPTTAHRRPRRSAVARRPDPASRLSTPRPTRNRSGGFAAAQAEHRTQARLAAARAARPARSSTGPHSWCSAANGSSISDSTPTARRTRACGRLHDVIHQRRLADAWIAAQRSTLRCRRAAPRRRAGSGSRLPRPTEQTCGLTLHRHAGGKVVPAVRSCACARVLGCGTRVARAITRSRATHLRGHELVVREVWRGPEPEDVGAAVGEHTAVGQSSLEVARNGDRRARNPAIVSGGQSCGRVTSTSGRPSESKVDRRTPTWWSERLAQERGREAVFGEEVEDGRGAVMTGRVVGPAAKRVAGRP